MKLNKSSSIFSMSNLSQGFRYNIFQDLSLSAEEFSEKDGVIEFGKKNVNIEYKIEYKARAVIYDPKTDRYCLQILENDRQRPILFGGTLEAGETVLMALKREIKEETGYTDYQIITQLGKEIFHYTKNVCGIDTVFLLLLNSKKQVELDLDEEESEQGSTIYWFKKEEVLAKLTEFYKNQNLSKLYGQLTHIEAFIRGITKVEELTLSNFFPEVLVATHNPSKLKRYKAQLEDLPVKLISLADLDLKLEIPQEIGENTLEISQNKVKFYFEKTQKVAFSSDSGLYFDGVENSEQPGKNIKGIAGATDEMSDEEIYDKIITFYSNLAKEYDGRLSGYFLDSYCLFDGNQFFTKEIKRPIVLTDIVRQKDIHFPIASLYTVNDKYYHDLSENEMNNFLKESIQGLREIISQWLASMTNNKNQEITLQTYQQNWQEYIDKSPKKPSEIFQKWIQKSLSLIQKDAKILEVGSGNGVVADFIESLGYLVTRTDAVESFIAYQKSLGKNISKLDLLNFQTSEKYDLILAAAVFLHFNERQLASILQNIKSILVNDGYLSFTVKKGFGEKYTNEKLGNPRYFRYWQEEEIKNLLEKCGFSNIQIQTQFVDEDTWIQVICSCKGD